MGRGIKKWMIFLDDQDRTVFLSRLADLAKDQSMKIFAWTLLPNCGEMSQVAGQLFGFYEAKVARYLVPIFNLPLN